jgi:hypothetical protein
MDAEQSSNRLLEITPLYPPYFKGEGEGNNLYFKDSPLKIRGVRGVMKEAPMKSGQLQKSGRERVLYDIMQRTIIR